MDAKQGPTKTLQNFSGLNTQDSARKNNEALFSKPIELNTNSIQPLRQSFIDAKIDVKPRAMAESSRNSHVFNT